MYVCVEIIVSCSYDLLHSVLPGTFQFEMRKNKSMTSDKVSSLLLKENVQKVKMKEQKFILHNNSVMYICSMMGCGLDHN
jgi:hypothetical protein